MTETTFTLERVARIEASLELDPDQRADILAANELDEDGWERVEATQDAAIRAALDRDDPSLLARYDAAYVARIEDERGTITVEEYASILAASRRGRAPERLAELGIPEAAELRLMRVFEARLVADEAAARSVRDALDD
jgi:hypothetical protein